MTNTLTAILLGTAVAITASELNTQRAKCVAHAPFLWTRPTIGPLYWAYVLVGSTTLLVSEPLMRLILWANKAIG